MQKLLTAIAAAILLAAGLAATATADELTMMVEKELAALGYDTGPVDGEETMETVIAISKFQAENGMEVSGEVTPQLAGILAAKAANPDLETGAAAPAAAAPTTRDPAELQAAQQACLQEKMAAAQEAQKKKRGFGRLLSAVTRTATQQGNYEVARTTSDIYSASATADDLAAAAKDLGLTEDEIAACQNPM
jgi:peptidoglycan hydrolase-like protein with peptidoglycan-binding domain